jgi:NADH-quinone oxidoreductase subunit E
MLAPKPNEHPMRYWISLWPTAPLFGVPWRFEGMAPLPPFFRPSAVAAKMSRAGADEAARTVEEAADVAERASDAAGKVVEASVLRTAATPEAPETIVQTTAPEPNGAGSTAAPELLFASAPEAPDDLKLIKGVGPKLEGMLNDMGIYTFAQIAGFTPENLAWVDDNLTAFKGRPLRDDWIAQAKSLM